MAEVPEGPWSEKWEGVGPLGGGGQGSTFRVRSRASGSEGVLKILKYQDRDQARRRMSQEVTNLTVLHNAGCKVPKVLDANVTEFEAKSTQLYFVMELVEGDTLADLVSHRGRLSLEQSLALARDLCTTVGKALVEGVIHRDLKPQNIVVRSLDPADVVVVDYGLSFNAEDPQDLTQTSETLDNSFLSLPERRIPGGDRRDPRSDLTGVCGILFYCITGTRPVDLTGPSGEPPHRRRGSSLHEVLGEDTRVPALDLFFGRGFASDLDQRFKNAQELLARLDDIANPKARRMETTPAAFAKESAKRLLQYDRRTQLSTYSRSAAEVTGALAAAIHANRKRLLPYGVEAHTGRPNGLILPGGADELQDGHLLVRVMHKEHGVNRAFRYAVVAKGAECGVFRSGLQGSLFQSGDATKSSASWELLHWIGGTTKPDATIIEALVNDLNACVVDCMRSIEEQIIKPH